MGVLFKKKSRPTKAEKSTLKNINNFLSSLDEGQKKRFNFDGEVVRNGDRLNEIWEVIKDLPNEKSQEFIEDNVVEEKQPISPNSNFEEESNVINNTESMNENIEDANIEEVIDDGASVEQDVNEVPSFFNPLGDPVKRRSYQDKGTTDVGEIEEPDFGSKASANEELEDIKQHEEESAYGEMDVDVDEIDEEEGGIQWGNLRNPQMEELDNKDAKLASKQLVSTVLDGYEMLHELAKRYVRYPEEKVQEKVMKGEIDPTMEIPMDEHGTTTNPIEFFQAFNEQAEDAISYDPEFGEKVRPAMERVFAKKGWGMTDEQFLMIAFGKDIAWKGLQVYNLKKTSNSIMNAFVQMQTDKNNAIKAAGEKQRASSRAHDPDSITTPPPRPEPRQEAYEEAEQYEDILEDAPVRADYIDEQNNDEVVPIH